MWIIPVYFSADATALLLQYFCCSVFATIHNQAQSRVFARVDPHDLVVGDVVLYLLKPRELFLKLYTVEHTGV